MIKFFEKYPEITAVMSEKKDGSMKFFKTGVLNLENQENRQQFFAESGIEKDKVIYAYLKNGVNVTTVEDNKLKIIPETDALITRQKNLYLSVTVADCVPVLFYDTSAKIIGIAHAGWRCIVGGIIKNTVQKITESGGRPENIVIALGPGINVCHFSIKADVLDEFKDYKEFLIEKDSQQFVDLKGIIKKQLLDLGIKPENIENNNECTFNNADRYFSYRRDKMDQENMEIMLALIGMKK